MNQSKPNIPPPINVEAAGNGFARFLLNSDSEGTLFVDTDNGCRLKLQPGRIRSCAIPGGSTFIRYRATCSNGGVYKGAAGNQRIVFFDCPKS